MKSISRDCYELSTGRTVAANCGYIGLSDDFKVSEGYDGHIDFGEWAAGFTEHANCVWTLAEKIELANYMAARWMAFARQLSEDIHPEFSIPEEGTVERDEYNYRLAQGIAKLEHK